MQADLANVCTAFVLLGFNVYIKIYSIFFYFISKNKVAERSEIPAGLMADD